MGSILKALNTAIFLAFWLSFLEPGVRALEVMQSVGIRGMLPSSDEALLHLLFDFFVPVFLLYFFLRSTALTRWIRVSPATHTKLFVANSLIVSIFFLAATGDPSGGIVIVLFLGLPAVFFSLTGTLSLLFQQAASNESVDPLWRHPISPLEIKVALVIALFVAFIFGGPVLLSSNSGLQLLTKNRSWISDQCKRGGVKINRQYSGALFIDESLENQSRFPGETGAGNKDIRRLLVEDAGVPRVEWKAHGGYYTYEKGGSFRTPIQAPTAKYVLSAKTTIERKLIDTRHVSGGVIAIRESSSGEDIATLGYFTSRYPPIYCGQTIGEFNLVEFVAQAYKQ